MVGKTETIEDGIGGSDFAPTAKSGIHYESSNNSLYIVAKRGARRVGNGTPNGSIFKYDLDTKKTTLIKQFGQIESEGKYPFGVVKKVGSKLYGVTGSGGEYNHGVIYSIDIATDTYTVIHSFNGTTDGGEPTCQLFKEGNILYGAGKRGNGDNGESFFSYDVSTSTFTPIYVGTLTASATIRGLFKRNNILYSTLNQGIRKLDMTNPSIGPTMYFTGLGGEAGIGSKAFEFTQRFSDANWYTIFEQGGINNFGSIARFDFSSSSIINVHNFQGGADGQSPSTQLVNGLAGAIYGTAPTGTGDQYVLYKVSSSGVYSILHTFNSTNDGMSISAVPVLVGGKLYGISESNGANDGGTIWSYDFDNNLFSVEEQLGFENGKSPVNGLASGANASEYLYSTYQGGNPHKGTVNQFNSTNNSTSLISIITDPKISKMYYRPILRNGKYYIFPEFGAGIYDSFFGLAELDINTGLIIGTPTLVSPSGTPNTSLPASLVYSSIIEEGGMIYGASLGDLWSIDIDNESFTSIYAFNAATDGNVTGSLIKNGTVFYGINDEGGTNSKGTIFKYDTNTSTYTVLSTTATDKAYTSLAIDGNTLYTIETDDTSKISTLVSMDASISNPPITPVIVLDKATYGTNPASSIIIENNIIYGILREDGLNGFGSLFSYSLTTPALSSVIDFDNTTGSYPYNGEMTYSSSSLGIDDLIKENIKIYPNPTTGIIQIKSTDISQVEVFTITGKRVLNIVKPASIDLTNYENGIYLLRLHKEGKVFTTKIVLTK